MAITTNDKNLGHATAYAYAKSKGYTGTEQEFATLMASYGTVAESAEESRQAAEEAQSRAEAAQTAAETAQTGAETAQTGAINAKDTAVSAVSTATTKAGEASQSATAAAGSAEDSEAWAIGKRDGVDVPSTDDAYQNNSKYWANEAERVVGEANYAWFDVDQSDGEMYVTMTPNLDADLSFVINENTGELEGTIGTTRTYSAGIATAYGAALAGGYTGTYGEFCAALGDLANVLEDFESFSVTLNTLPEGSSATVSYADGVLTLGIPKGDTGNGIASITLTSTSGAVKTYTITFTDGTTTTFDVTDGEVTAAQLAAETAARESADSTLLSAFDALGLSVIDGKINMTYEEVVA